MAKGDMNVRVGVDTQPMEQGLTKSKALLLGFAGGIGAAVAGIVGNAIRNVGAFISESVRESAQQIQAENELLIALKGRVGAQQELIAQAKELQKTTIFGDDETINAQARLGIYIKEANQIKQLTPLIQDLAIAKKIDLASAADLVGRAIGSEMKTIRGLGITLEGNAGSAEKAQSAIEQLTEAVGGQAAAAAKVGAGPLVQLKNAWGDVREELGKVLLPVISRVAGALKTFSEFISDNIDRIKDFGQTVLLTAKWLAIGAAAFYATKAAIFVYNLAIGAATISTTAFNSALTFLRTALLKSGIGAFVVALGAAVAYVDKVWRGIDATRKSVEELNRITGKYAETQRILNSVGSAKSLKLFERLELEAAREELTKLIGSLKVAQETAGRLANSPVKNALAAQFDPKKLEEYERSLKKVNAELAARDKVTKDLTEALEAERKKREELQAVQVKEIELYKELRKEQEAYIALQKAQDGVINGLKQGNEEWAESFKSVDDAISEFDKSPFEARLKAMREVEDQMHKVELATIGLSAVTQLLNDISNAAALDEAERAKAYRDAAYKIVQSLIAEGVASMVSSAIKNSAKTGPLGLALAVPLGAAAGAAALALFSSAVPKFAEGGLAYAPTMAIVGDNPNAKSDPEVIAPLSKLAGMLRKQGGDVTVRGRLVGEDIYLSNERAFRRINRANGY